MEFVMGAKGMYLTMMCLGVLAGAITVLTLLSKQPVMLPLLFIVFVAIAIYMFMVTTTWDMDKWQYYVAMELLVLICALFYFFGGILYMLICGSLRMEQKKAFEHVLVYDTIVVGFLSFVYFCVV